MRIAITGIGFICPVGRTVWEAALALRKKKSRFFCHETVLVADDRHSTVLRGATVSRMPDDIVSPRLGGTDRAVALLSIAVQECLAGIDPWFLRATLWQVDNLAMPDDRDFPRRLQAALPRIRINPWEIDAASVSYSRCAFFERIIKMAERLRSDKNHQMAVVGCADSLVTPPRLEELLHAERLKDAAHPEGILVGEAAGVILLEKEEHARRRNATVYATLASWGCGREEAPSAGNSTTAGRALTKAFLGAFAGLDDAGESVGAVISDLNGERDRALEWAYTEGRIFSGNAVVRALKHPADTLGDCGGAMGAALIVDALACFMLHHRAPLHVALSSSDQSGERRVICLERGDHLERRKLMAGIREKLCEEKRSVLLGEEG